MMRPSGVSTIAIISVYVLTSAASQPVTRSLLPGATPETSQQENCFNQEHPCVSKGQLPHSDGKCYTPMDRGPCPKDQVITLDIDAGSKRLRGRCKSLRCPYGFVPSEGRCLAEAKSLKLCASGTLYLDPAGIPLCGDFPGWRNLLLTYIRCYPRKKRQVRMDFPFRKLPNKRVIWVHNAPCAVQNNGDCSNYVLGLDPRIVIETEK